MEIIEARVNGIAPDIENLKALIDEKTSAVIVQNPNFFGAVEDYTSLSEHASSKGAVVIMCFYPVSLGILKSPGEMKAEIAVAEAQSLGMPLSFGGPYLGMMAVNKKYVRKIPGRIVGETVDKEGKRAYVLTLQAREQHIKREKATSNICSNQGLNSLAATVYMVTMGKEGLREVALQSTKKAHYAYEQLIKSGKFKPAFDKPFFKEFALTSDIAPEKINEALRKENIIGGYDLGKEYPQFENGILYAVTEKRTKDEIDKLTSVMEGI